MPTYRAYLLNAAGSITWGDWLEAADLDDARTKAHELCSSGAPTVELWRGVDHLATLACDDDAA